MSDQGGKDKAKRDSGLGWGSGVTESDVSEVKLREVEERLGISGSEGKP